MKVMAIDLGDARTGIAVSDAMGWLTGFTTVIHSWNKDKTAQEIAALVKTHRPERIVMGFPRNMDGSEGPRADLYREFAALLEELLDQPVVLWDERRNDGRGASDPVGRRLSRKKAQEYSGCGGCVADFGGATSIISIRTRSKA